MSNPFGGIGAICVSENLGRCTQTSLHFLFSCFYITKDNTTELMVILNLFQDLSAEKDKNRLAVRC